MYVPLLVGISGLQYAAIPKQLFIRHSAHFTYMAIIQCNPTKYNWHQLANLFCLADDVGRAIMHYNKQPHDIPGHLLGGPWCMLTMA